MPAADNRVYVRTRGRSEMPAAEVALGCQPLMKVAIYESAHSKWPVHSQR
jgi:hypothetical protein